MLAVKQRLFTCSGQWILQLRLQQRQRAVLICQPRLHGTFERLPNCTTCWQASSQLRCCTPIPQLHIMQPRHMGSLPHMSVTVNACLQQPCSADVSHRALCLALCLSAVAPACTFKSWFLAASADPKNWQSAQPGICRTRCLTYRNSQPNSQSRAMICCFGGERLSAKEIARSPSASELHVTASQLMPWHADRTSRTSAGSRTFVHRSRLINRAAVSHLEAVCDGAGATLHAAA